MRRRLLFAWVASAAAGCAPEPRAVDVPVTPQADRSELPVSASASASTPEVPATAPAETSAAATPDAAAGWNDDGGFGVGSGNGPPAGTPTSGDGGAPLGTEPIRRVVLSHVGALQACYEIEAQKNPALAGTITLSWTIDPSGVVSQAAVASTTMHDERVEKCIVRQVKSWHFPPAGRATTVNYPFKFAVSDGGA